MHRHVLLVLAAIAVVFTGCDSVQSEGPASALRPQSLTASPSIPAGGATAINPLTSACHGETSAWFRINNDARPAQTYTWKHLPSGETGSVSVDAGDRAFFQTPYVLGDANVTVLYVNEGEVSRKSTNGDLCPTLSGHINAIPDGSDNPSAGSGLKDVRVQVYFAGATPGEDAPIYEDVTDGDGRYAFENLPAYMSGTVPYVEYLVVVPDEDDGETFNSTLYEFFDPINEPLAVSLPNASVDDADIGFDGDDAALVSEVKGQNAEGRATWSVRELRQAFDRYRKGKDQGNAVLSQEQLLEITRSIVDDPYENDAYFGLSFPFLGPVRASGGTPYSDQELLDWGYEVLRDVPKGPQDPAARLYSLVFACQINYLGGQGLADPALDLALQGYLEADVNANSPGGQPGESLTVASSVMISAARLGGGGGGTVELAAAYLGGGGGGTVEY